MTANAVAYGRFVSPHRFVAYLEIKRNVGWEVAYWINLACKRDKCLVVNMAMNFSTK
jgi:hypothetical protein